MTSHLILYSTSACHLCENAELLLADSQLTWQTFEIADSDELLERYGSRIPVLANTLTHKELDWPFSASDIAAFIL